MNKGILYLMLFMTFLSSSEVTYNRNAVSKEPPASHVTKIFTEDEFQFQIKSKDITIKLGSTREEVEQQLGLHVDYYYYTNVYQYKDMRIHYKDGIVDGIMIDGPAKFKTYKTPSGIGYGSTVQEVFQKYGKKAFIDTKTGKVKSITYVMEENKQGNYHVIPSFDHAILEGGFENMKGLSMNFDQKGRVSFIMLASHEFAYNPEFNKDDIQ
ncbi:hypothetical protein NSQ20_08310 [Paenibacillus sp. FSL K6-1122]|uniref:hypothetical protein n=1 Tax=unclassified Paenibacillus TaxID=185978 RepID=UPI00056A23C1|nr:hypothetical protein [Paenibacillus sp. FSL H7-689]